VPPENLQGSFQGYVSLVHTSLEYPMFQYVLFVSSEELSALKTQINRLFTGGASPKERVLNVFMEVLATHYGSREMKSQIRTQTPAGILEMQTGLPASSPLLKQYTVEQLEELPEEEVNKIVIYLKDKYDRLAQIDYEFQKYSYMSQDVRYFWIPLNAMP
jgi:hypothetical protein